jgi:hypothetical protein
VLSVLLLATLTVVSAHVDAQARAAPAAAPSPLRITAIDVQPSVAAPDTLCKLRVKISNSGANVASDLTFEVTLNGRRLASYLKHTFHVDLAAGKETELALYNFWTSEAGRPFPKDGRLVVEVRLTGARWRGKQAGDSGQVIAPLPPGVSVTLTPKRS